MTLPYLDPSLTREEVVAISHNPEWRAASDELMRYAALRKERDRLLAETDWMANSDVTLPAAWKTYRQELRDLPATTTPDFDENGKLTGVTWPTKPE
tara:strand:+ start:1009 stop:1299 length:291 start_codon:yes stop_codon:yes gene_type:complete